MQIFEAIAVIFGILYILLAMRENRWCWVTGFISTAIFAALFFVSQLYMESLLQVYYVVMACYGWRQWQDKDQPLAISNWSLQQHFVTLSCIFVLSMASSAFLSYYTDATYPLQDSIITWGSLIATYMSTRKILENWLYWVALNSLALFCCFNKSLYLTAGLYLIYATLAIGGYFAWRHPKISGKIC